MAQAYFHLVEHSAVDSCKRIGIFATRRDAEAALAQVRNAPGFREAPAGFRVTRVRVELPEGILKAAVREVFLAYHEFWDEAEQCDFWTEGPMRTTRAAAEADLAEMRRDARLAGYPEGFDIGGAVVGQVGWAEGFTSGEA